jgi:hypothetical protein
VSLSDLARATGAMPGALEGATASGGLAAERAEMARALASLSEPARSLTSFTGAELSRGTALLRARVLRGAFSSARDLRRAQMNDLSAELGRLARSEGSASSLGFESAPAEQGDPSWRAFLLLTRSDRTLLSLLYVSAQTQGGDLSVVDDVARALLVLRQREQAGSGPGAQRAASSPMLAAPRVPAVSEPPAGRASEPPASAEHDGERTSQAPWRSSSDSFMSRSFGAGLAARAVSSYRSLLPPAPKTMPSVPPSAANDALPVATTTSQSSAQEAAASAALARPFSAAQALGVGSLIDSLTRNLQTTRRQRPKRPTRAERGTRSELAEQDPERDAHRRARWHELFRRRRAQRAARAAR